MVMAKLVMEQGKRRGRAFGKRYQKAEVMTAAAFLAPSVCLWIFWFFVPAVKSMRLSFFDYSFVNPENESFVGLRNYIRLFQDQAFLKALQHTFMLAFIVVALIAVLAFIVAVLIDGKIKGKTFFRTVYFMPYIISAVAVSIFFMYFFVKDGIGTKLFSLLGTQNTTWFTSTRYALYLVAIIYIWQQIGFYMILYIGGLQNISSEIYEAARIDGAGRLQSVLHITVPLVKPTTYMVVTLGMINAFQIFDQIAAISKQSPLGSPAGSTSTVVTFLYQQSFSYMDMGYGSAAAMVLVVIIFVLSLLRNLISREGN